MRGGVVDGGCAPLCGKAASDWHEQGARRERARAPMLRPARALHSETTARARPPAKAGEGFSLGPQGGYPQVERFMYRCSATTSVSVSVSVNSLLDPLGGGRQAPTLRHTRTFSHTHTQQTTTTHKSTSAAPPYGAQLEHRSWPFGQRECESPTESKTKPQRQLAAQQEPQMGPGQARQACRWEARSSIATGW